MHGETGTGWSIQFNDIKKQRYNEGNNRLKWERELSGIEYNIAEDTGKNFFKNEEEKLQEEEDRVEESE